MPVTVPVATYLGSGLPYQHAPLAGPVNGYWAEGHPEHVLLFAVPAAPFWGGSICIDKATLNGTRPDSPAGAKPAPIRPSRRLSPAAANTLTEGHIAPSGDTNQLILASINAHTDLV